MWDLQVEVFSGQLGNRRPEDSGELWITGDQKAVESSGSQQHMGV